MAGMGRKRCGRGKSCGATCIEKLKVCRKDFPLSISGEVSTLSRELSSSKHELASPPKLEPQGKMGSPPTPNNLDSLKTPEDFTKKLSDTKKYYDKSIEGFHEWVKRLIGPAITEKLDPVLVKMGLIKPPSYESEQSSSHFGKLRDSLIKGMGEEGVLNSLKAIKDFTSGEYGAIRKAQMGNPKYRGYLDKANAIEAFIARDEVIKPSVEKFRGIVVSPNALQGMVESAKTKGSYSGIALASWSTELKTARNFTDSVRGMADQRVILRSINSKGIPVGSVSSTGSEYEILTSSKANYKYLGYNQVEVKGLVYHVFDVEEF